MKRAYKQKMNKNSFKRSQLTSVELVEGETIEQKVERLVQNKEPIKDGAPEIFTDRKDGVQAAYNIRTDRFEIAAEAMDKVHKSTVAKRDNVGKVIEMKPKTETKTETKTDSGAEPIQGEQNNQN
jgi:hypothetical protein